VRLDDPLLLTVSGIISFGLYFALGYGLACLFRSAQGWRIAGGIALPLATFLALWIYDVTDNGPRSFLYIPARVLWLMPGALILRFFGVR